MGAERAGAEVECGDLIPGTKLTCYDTTSIIIEGDSISEA